jgi:hypothetical protein
MKLNLSRNSPHFVVREGFVTLCTGVHKFSNFWVTWMHFKFSKPICSEIHLTAPYLYSYLLSDFRLNCWYISHFHNLGHVFWPSNLPWFEHRSTTCWPAYVTNLLIIQKFESSCHYISYFQIFFRVCLLYSQSLKNVTLFFIEEVNLKALKQR